MVDALATGEESALVAADASALAAIPPATSQTVAAQRTPRLAGSTPATPE